MLGENELPQINLAGLNTRSDRNSIRPRVNKDGIVQALTVISGPDIVTLAALEAVKQWRFKPHYESGEAVPTETRITVNFTISTP